MRSGGRFSVLLAATLLTTGAALACPICFSGRASAIGQKIDAADAVVLASPGPSTGAFQVVRTIVGDHAEGSVIVDAHPTAADPAVPQGSMLLVRNKPSQQWTALGSLGTEDSDWLRRFASHRAEADDRAPKGWPRTVGATFDLTESEWNERLHLVAPRLEDPQRLVAEIAYGEIARSPYRSLRQLRGTHTAATVLTWLDDPALVARQSGYTLLLGIVGGPPEANLLEARIESIRARHGTANLAALIAADLEIRGPSRVAYVEQAYLSDKSRQLPEIEAALLALSEHGGADAAVPRARVVAAYRAFVVARPQMAAFVIPDLLEWQAFDLTAEVKAALESGAIKDQGSRYQALTYLQHAPARPRLVQQGAGSDLPP